jgi:ribosome recycling factor
VGEISNIVFKRMIIRIINEMKKDMYKYLNKFKESTHEEINEIRETMQGIKGYNKDTEILKDIKLKFWK